MGARVHATINGWQCGWRRTTGLSARRTAERSDGKTTGWMMNECIHKRVFFADPDKMLWIINQGFQRLQYIKLLKRPDWAKQAVQRYFAISNFGLHDHSFQNLFKNVIINRIRNVLSTISECPLSSTRGTHFFFFFFFDFILFVQ